MRKIRVLFVIGQLSAGGTELQLLQLVRGLNRAHFESVVVGLSGISPSLISKYREMEIPTAVLGREARGRLLTLWKLAQLIKDFKPDVVHAFGYASRAAIPVSKILLSSKRIVSIRNDPTRVIAWIDKLINSFADFALINFQKASDPINLSFRSDLPVQVIYNGIDLCKFDLDASIDDPLSVSRFPGETKIICAVARLYPQKGLDILLDAFAALSKSMGDIQLWLVGDGPEKKKLEERCSCLSISANVFFWGQQENVPSILKHADIGVLSSYYEGLPNAILEYMAAGLPVVATNVGGAGEVILDGETGLLIPPGNPKILADKLLFLLSNSETACQFGIAGRKRVKSCFTLERMVNQTEIVYHSIMCHGKA